LVDNAIRFSADGDITITITRDQAPDLLICQVKDCGNGIPPAIADNLFRPFTQASQPGIDQGIGIGLAICRECAELLGGTIELTDNNPNQGCTFTFRFHGSLDDHYEDDVITEPTAHQVVGLAVDQAQPTILILDHDSSRHARIAGELRAIGLVVASVTAYHNALEYCRNHQPDLILIHPPDVDSAENLAILRSLGRDLPPLIVAYQEADQQTGAPGADVVLPLPLPLGRLLAVMEQHRGIRFKYNDQPDSDIITHRSMTLSQANRVLPNIAALPPDIRADLAAAADHLDPAGCSAVLERIPERYLSQRQHLQELIDQFEFHAIAQLCATAQE
jgi:CheY-like chemotaxis protein